MAHATHATYVIVLLRTYPGMQLTDMVERRAQPGQVSCLAVRHLRDRADFEHSNFVSRRPG